MSLLQKPEISRPGAKPAKVGLFSQLFPDVLANLREIFLQLSHRFANPNQGRIRLTGKQLRLS